jgi:hypothetical protein
MLDGAVPDVGLEALEPVVRGRAEHAGRELWRRGEWVEQIEALFREPSIGRSGCGSEQEDQDHDRVHGARISAAGPWRLPSVADVVAERFPGENEA